MNSGCWSLWTHFQHEIRPKNEQQIFSELFFKLFDWRFFLNDMLFTWQMGFFPFEHSHLEKVFLLFNNLSIWLHSIKIVAFPK